jgi:hypothetical protein
MASLVAGRAEAAGLEVWLTRIAVWTAAIGTLAFLLYPLGRVVGFLSGFMGDAPWPLLAATLSIFGMIKLMEFLPPWARNTRGAG